MSLKALMQVPVKVDWHKPEGSDLWCLSLGRRGCSMRVTQREAGGPFFAETRIAGRRTQEVLNTSSRPQARERAAAVLLRIHELRDGASGPLTIRRLWELYSAHSGAFQQNTEPTRKGKASAARRLCAVFGESKDVNLLSKNDVERYLVHRVQKGSLGSGRKNAIGTRTSADDMCVLRAMVRWALNERLPDGRWLLKENPLRGVKLPKEESPRRPVVSADHFAQMRRATQDLAISNNVATRLRWIRLELALVLAEATGARIGSIRGVRWSDIDYEHATIRWAPEHHKRRRETVVPLPRQLRDELRHFQTKIGAVGDTWLFPTKNPDQPWPREVFQQMWVRAERHAGLPHQKGGCWHTLRRKWAIERKHLPVVDVAGAGGWKDFAVLQTVYQIPTQEGMRAVMEYSGKLRPHHSTATGGSTDE